MPIYEYACRLCGHEEEEFQFMADSPLEQCPKCGEPGYKRRPSLPHSDMIDFHTPIQMYSIALNDDDEIRAFKRKAPDVYVETDPKSEMYGIPIARTRKQKLEALGAMGHVEVR